MSFEKAFNLTMMLEGGYANIKGDSGGETYMGIARRYHPHWAGWEIVDNEKAKHGGTLRNNYFIKNTTLDKLVFDFYHVNFWKKLHLGQVKDEAIQEIIFDFVVNSGKRAIVKLQLLLSADFEQNILVDGIMGNQTVRAINNCNPKQLFNAIKKMRKDFYESIAKKNGKGKFLKGWLKRLSHFNYKTVGITTVSILFIIAGAFLVKRIIDNNNNNNTETTITQNTNE